MKRTMLYPIKPGCFRPRTDGTSNIHIQYCYTSKQRTLLDTEIYILPYRDDFVLGCLTGLRFFGFSVLESPDIRGEFLHKKQQKSSYRVVIPLRQAAKDILEHRFQKDYEPLTNTEFNRVTSALT